MTVPVLFYTGSQQKYNQILTRVGCEDCSRLHPEPLCPPVFFSWLVGRAITLPFRQVQQFVQRATAWATATEIWVKNGVMRHVNF